MISCQQVILELDIGSLTRAHQMKMETSSKMKMTKWHGSDSDHPFFAQSMYIGALISLLFAVIHGLSYVMIAYVSYETTRNCQFHAKETIPVKIQWIRTLSQVIGDAFLYVWFFVEMLFLFRPYQLRGVKRKLIIVAFVLFCVDAVHRVVLQVFVISHSQLSVTQKIPLNIMSLSSICWKVYLLTNHFRILLRRAT